MRFYWLLLGTLAVWRVTHLLNAEDGPWNLLVKFRRVFGNGALGTLLDCFYCLSLWVAAPLAWWVGDGWKERLLLWPTLSGGAILLQEIYIKRSETPSTVYWEEKENEHVLRQESGGDESSRQNGPSI